jgi:histidine ammonia-lyase
MMLANAFATVEIAVSGQLSRPATGGDGLAVFFLIGLFGGAPCIGMCGPLVATHTERMGNTEVLEATLSIHSVEANYQTYFQLLHLQRPAPDAFNSARSMEQILTISQ